MYKGGGDYFPRAELLNDRQDGRSNLANHELVQEQRGEDANSTGDENYEEL